MKCGWVNISIIFCLVCASSAFAENWVCEEAASIRQGNTMLVCGVGLGWTEADARLEALRHAKKEFEEICSPSADCQGHRLTVEPLRNDCRRTENQAYKCYRAIRYQIGSTLDSESYLEQVKLFLDEEIDLTQKKLSKMKEVRERQKKLKDLQTQVESGGEKPAPPLEPDPDEDVNLMVGAELGLMSPVFAVEGITSPVGASLQYRANRYFGLEAGGNLDLFMFEGRMKTGLSYYGSISIYLKRYASKNVLFLGPDFRSFKHDDLQHNSIGLVFGWQNLVPESATGIRLRGGVFNLLGADSDYPFVVGGGLTYMFGI